MIYDIKGKKKICMANAHSFRKKEKKIFTEIIFSFVKEKPQQREKLFSETILKDPIMYSYVSLLDSEVHFI